MTRREMIAHSATVAAATSGIFWLEGNAGGSAVGVPINWRYQSAPAVGSVQLLSQAKSLFDLDAYGQKFSLAADPSVVSIRFGEGVECLLLVLNPATYDRSKPTPCRLTISKVEFASQIPNPNGSGQTPTPPSADDIFNVIGIHNYKYDTATHSVAGQIDTRGNVDILLRTNSILSLPVKVTVDLNWTFNSRDYTSHGFHSGYFDISD